jgi:hypothetical protein
MGNNSSKEGINNEEGGVIYNTEKKILHILFEANNSITNLSEIYLNITLNSSTELFHYLEMSEIDKDFWQGYMPGFIFGNNIDIRAMLVIDNNESPSGRLNIKISKITHEEVLLYLYCDEGHMISADLFPYNETRFKRKELSFPKFEINAETIYTYLKYKNLNECIFYLK